MTDFKKGLLLGIGMVVVFGTFVAFTKNSRADYIVQQIETTEMGKPKEVTYLHYKKDLHSKSKTEVYKCIKVETFDIVANDPIGDLVKSEEHTINIKDGTYETKTYGN